MVRPESGQRFAHFQVYSVLGRGGMGVVFSAYNDRDHRVVALKLLPVNLARDPNARERFRRESELARSLQSPNAVPVLDAGEHAEELWLEMPLLPGETLEKLARRTTRIPVERVVPIVTQIARALDDAHAIGLIHRDVKPANVLLVERHDGAEPHAFLGDFGLTQLAVPVEPGLTAVDEVVGTCEYMSPEQAARETLDARTDVYALGCLTHRVLAGAPPFRGAPLEVMEAHQSEPPPPLRTAGAPVGAAVERVVLTALAKNRNDRPRSAGAFAKELAAAAAADGR